MYVYLRTKLLQLKRDSLITRESFMHPIYYVFLHFQPYSTFCFFSPTELVHQILLSTIKSTTFFPPQMLSIYSLMLPLVCWLRRSKK